MRIIKLLQIAKASLESAKMMLQQGINNFSIINQSIHPQYLKKNPHFFEEIEEKSIHFEEVRNRQKSRVLLPVQVQEIINIEYGTPASTVEIKLLDFGQLNGIPPICPSPYLDLEKQFVIKIDD